jgi:hypothetical protein
MAARRAILGPLPSLQNRFLELRRSASSIRALTAFAQGARRFPKQDRSSHSDRSKELDLQAAVRTDMGAHDVPAFPAHPGSEQPKRLEVGR